MQMRLSLARALATDPNILLLDEPFAAVDDFLRMRLQEDIRRLHEDRQLTTVLVTHNIQEAVFLSDQVIVFSGTPAHVRESVTIQWQGPREAKFRDSDEYVKYTRQLNSVLNQQRAGL
jgi:NitT/TauT family transport system ATP-binding protein